MTKISIKKVDNLIQVIKVSGHSGYANKGSDIVCSSITTAMYVSYGMLDKAKCDFTFNTNEDKPFMELKINKSNDITKLVMENLVDVLEGIAFDYKANVTIINE